MKEEKEFLVRLLKEAGVRSNVYTAMKKLKMANEMHLGAVLAANETFMRSKSKKAYLDQEGNRKNRHKEWDRSTELKVVIAASDEERCEGILNKFLLLLPKGIYIDGNWASIEMGEADWVEEGDSVLKSKMAVEFSVTFRGGVYRDETMQFLNVGKVQGKEEPDGGKKHG